MNNTITKPKLKIAHYSDSADMKSRSLIKPSKKQPEELTNGFVISPLVERRRQQIITALPVFGLCLVAGLFLQTKDLLMQEGLKAIAVVLLICQLRNLSQTQNKW